MDIVVIFQSIVLVKSYRFIDFDGDSIDKLS